MHWTKGPKAEETRAKIKAARAKQDPKSLSRSASLIGNKNGFQLGNASWNTGTPATPAQKACLDRTGIPHTEEFRARRSREMYELRAERGDNWYHKDTVRFSDETRAKLSAAGLGNTNGFQKKAPSFNLGKPMSAEQKAKISKAHKGKKLTLEHREAIRVSMIDNPKVIANLAKQKVLWQNTAPELQIADLLQSKNLAFEPQFRLPGINHAFDLAIPTLRLLIEVDGCYWHACPIHCPNEDKGTLQLERSRKADRMARALGWSIIHIWQHDVANPLDLLRRI